MAYMVVKGVKKKRQNVYPALRLELRTARFVEALATTAKDLLVILLILYTRKMPFVR